MADNIKFQSTFESSRNDGILENELSDGKQTYGKLAYTEDIYDKDKHKPLSDIIKEPINIDKLGIDVTTHIEDINKRASIFNITNKTGKKYINFYDALSDVPTEYKKDTITTIAYVTDENKLVMYARDTEHWSDHNYDWHLFEGKTVIQQSIVNGNVTNNPDDFDIEAVTKDSLPVLQFKNRMSSVGRKKYYVHGVERYILYNKTKQLLNTLPSDFPNTLENTDFIVNENIYIGDFYKLGAGSRFICESGKVNCAIPYSDTIFKSEPIVYDAAAMNMANAVRAEDTNVTINVNGVINPSCKECATNSATWDFSNGYIDRKDDNGNDLEYKYNRYGRGIIKGRYKFWGNGYPAMPIYQEVRFSEACKSFNESLDKVYNRVLFKLGTNENVFKVLLLDVDEINITDTVYLCHRLSIKGDSSCILNIDIDDATKPVFDINTKGNIKSENTAIPDSTFANINQGNPSHYLLIENIRFNAISTNFLTVFRNSGGTAIFKNITFPYNYRGLFYLPSQRAVGNNPGAYDDFIYFENVSLSNMSFIDNSDQPYNIILPFGDGVVMRRCYNMNVLCFGGQKKFDSCLQVNVDGYYSQILMENYHNEECNCHFYNSDVTIIDGYLFPATRLDYNTIEINNPKLPELIQSIEDKYGLELFRQKISEFSEFNTKDGSFISLINVSFGEYCYQRLPIVPYDIYFYNDYYKLYQQNTRHVNGLWRMGTVYTGVPIYTNKEFGLFTDITEINVDTLSSKIRLTRHLSNNNENTAGHNVWSGVENIRKEISAFVKDTDGNYIADSISINYVTFLLDADRMLGKTVDSTLSGSYPRGGETPTAGMYYCGAIFNINTKCNALVDATINNEHKQAILPFVEDNLHNGSIGINTNTICGRYWQELNHNKEEINECIKIERFNNKENVRAYLNELPKYGTWTNGDECIINNVTLYSYMNSKWYKKFDLE